MQARCVTRISPSSRFVAYTTHTLGFTSDLAITLMRDCAFDREALRRVDSVTMLVTHFGLKSRLRAYEKRSVISMGVNMKNAYKIGSAQLTPSSEADVTYFS